MKKYLKKYIIYIYVYALVRTCSTNIDHFINCAIALLHAIDGISVHAHMCVRYIYIYIYVRLSIFDGWWLRCPLSCLKVVHKEK